MKRQNNIRAATITSQLLKLIPLCPLLSLSLLLQIYTYFLAIFLVRNALLPIFIEQTEFLKAQGYAEDYAKDIIGEKKNKWRNSVNFSVLKIGICLKFFCNFWYIWLHLPLFFPLLFFFCYFPICHIWAFTGTFLSLLVIQILPNLFFPCKKNPRGIFFIQFIFAFLPWSHSLMYFSIITSPFSDAKWDNIYNTKASWN